MGESGGPRLWFQHAVRAFSPYVSAFTRIVRVWIPGLDSLFDLVFWVFHGELVDSP